MGTHEACNARDHVTPLRILHYFPSLISVPNSMFQIYLSCSRELHFWNWISILPTLIVSLVSLYPRRSLLKNTEYRSVELINRLIAYIIFNSIDMAAGRMRNISAGYDHEQNKDHENGESCWVYLSYEFLVWFKLLAQFFLLLLFHFTGYSPGRIRRQKRTCILYLTIRLRARVFYEQIVKEAQPSWLSLVENEGE